ncbi:UNVERIFIED_ORG: MHS family alpha-ketoglutarate permease-like MFS transporter [Methylobacterium sp. SuP10 SLI 274]|uniref:MFS family transporter n=1 Tax=Methylorubrum extorquens TaxID=408 RepID=UPI00209D9B45|nr:MFS family transporter [Methylorubrum extorquens]MDF9862768.1 MHS family alpha-ketoglutarate permease-like MFS transporter [Methylorubrum pseudosasae]MDH6636379.1 MHS family alpha-ketoglutarate permease-like MFS transporter [Methylobacterium sp. SuP10 SLI 274]MDH6665557.1 MHS family alpha-ketoglutarate permease-like MFS transporter [Methylorubrum zatmanii]MCP1557477.1 MHS family alpha-ketoglutarate permease-like MFS transporter [Methylorubrum extorquens]MDF9791064.1 MHS family alpha-ketoglu
MLDTSAAAPPLDEAADRRRRIMAIVGSSSGNLVEWYDFYCYAFFALYFAPVFFPEGDDTGQLLKSAAVFAVGFFMRPIGGWLFGRIADRLGRKTSLMISVLMMCGGSLAIALLPTYATVGHLAPVLLVIARMVQGLSVGGEYGTSATYMSEVATKGQRGFFASFQYVTLIGGQLLASLVLVVLQSVLTAEQLTAWGWRIPFVIGALAAVVALFLRRSLSETMRAENKDSKEAGTLSGLLKHWRAFAVVLAYTAGGSLSFYTLTTYMPKYLFNTAHIDKVTASQITTVALFAYMAIQPFFGWLSDRIGRKTNMLLFSGLGMVMIVPLMTAIGTTTDPVLSFGLIMTGLVVISFYTGISGIVKAELFPTQVRALGVGLSYAVANSLFGGTAEAVALWLKHVGAETSFFWYVAVMLAISFIASLVMPNPKRHGYLDGDGTVEEALGRKTSPVLA